MQPSDRPVKNSGSSDPRTSEVGTRPYQRAAITPKMIEAGIRAWNIESSFWGPPEVEAGPVVEAIYRAMVKASLLESGEEH